jgi:hypothetical protein
MYAILDQFNIKSVEEKLLKSEKNSLNFASLYLGIMLFTATSISFFINPIQAQTQSKTISPTIATVKAMTNGDITCYVDLVDTNGKKHAQVPASFGICAQEKNFLNKKVRLTYSKVKVSDCQSAEPCGMTKLATLITKMTIIGSAK